MQTSDLQTPVPPELLPRSRLVRRIQHLLRIPRKGFARIAELSPTRMNVSWIDDHLAVGGAFHADDIPRLKEMGITAVVDCREEAADDAQALARNGIAFLHLPAPDAHEISQDLLDRGVAWVEEQFQAGTKIYVHCLHGVGRGPLLGCCVLVSRGMSEVDALNLVKARRWQASPNEEQVTALHRYAERHRQTPAPE